MPGAGIHQALPLPGGLSGRSRQLTEALDALCAHHRKVRTVPFLPTCLGSRGKKRILTRFGPRSSPWVRISKIRALWPIFSTVPTPQMQETSGSCAQGPVEWPRPELAARHVPDVLRFAARAAVAAQSRFSSPAGARPASRCASGPPPGPSGGQELQRPQRRGKRPCVCSSILTSLSHIIVVRCSLPAIL